jgi:S1-C subfamily serine protease
VIGGGVAGLLLAIGSVVAVVLSLSSGGGQPVLNAARSQAQLVLELPNDGRRNIKLIVDSQPRTLPASGPVELPLDAGMHTLTIQRRGYQQIDHSFTLRRGERLPFSPAWETSLAPPIASAGSESSGDGSAGGLAGGGLAGGGIAGVPNSTGGFAGAGGTSGGGGPTSGGTTVGGPGSVAGPSGFPNWPQNFEVAQKQALASKRDIFLVFAGSDWSQQTQVMASAIFSQPRFRSFVEQRFVPLVVDLPRTETGLNQLENINQNRSLSRQFGVRSVPVVLLLDAGGTPYAADGFFGEPLDKYIQHITLLQNKRAQRDVRLEAVDKARDKGTQEYLNAMEQAVRWIEQERLTPHYGTIFARWLALARQLDPQNELGKQEVFFEADWIARLNAAMVDGERIKVAAVLGDLLNWSKTRKFVDPDRAVRVHLSSAMLQLQAMDDEDAAVRHVDFARQYAPVDEKLKDELSNVQKWARQREQLSSGTGFIIAAEGYLLTNHHVVAGPGRTVVRIPAPSSDSPPANAPAGSPVVGNANAMRNVPAEVVASDAKQDIALLKIDPAAFPVFTPLPLGGERVRRGADVAVFGFPLGEELGKDVRITTGVVHSPSDQSDDKRHVLDCRINPGNSGGPVLNRLGHVIGMVTAKTVGGLGVDSYGVAIPSAELQAFLQAHLPPTAVRPLASSAADGASGQRRDWEEIDAAVSPGVLMVLKLKEP